MSKPAHRFSRTCLLLLALFVQTAPLPAALPAAVDGQPLPTLAPMLARTTPAVVNIAAIGHVEVARNPLLMEPLFQHFFNLPSQPRQRQTQSLGSGVIVDADKGYILTNNHVVEQADKISVTLRDGRQFNARLLGTDKASDIAVIQIPAENLTALPLADSDVLRVGDFVVAIGNPFGLGQTVTSGIVSALGRTDLGIEGYEDFIQTDASINPGNSGGALVNLRGELVGINTAILAPGGGNVGIGFAIPINMAASIMQQLVEHGEVERGQLGITAQDLSPELAKAFGIDRNSGTVISRIEPGSPADRSGLKVGDVILEIDGKPVRSSGEVRNRVGLLRVGTKVNMTLWRDGRTFRQSVVIEPVRLEQIAGEKLHYQLDGATFSNLPENLRTGNDPGGVLVSAVEPGSAAWRASLRKGDIIRSANRVALRDLDDFKRAVKGRRKLLINVQRGDGAMFILLQ
ncbi:MAG TPA: DegQ family serine endoprotease [Gammaproteobacteria bacterium]|nr:DegQ family serine endoprotease [Gammaproteobacteria bacterium]